MSDYPDKTFVDSINQNLGIAHKIARFYFDKAEEREDIIQEMMFQLWQSYPGFDGRSKFSTWMYSVCLNTALSYHRKSLKMREENLSDRHYQIADQAQDQDDEPVTLLLKAVATLSELNKALVLLYLDDLSYEEIGSILGLSRSNVGVRLVRIKKELEIKLRSLI